MTTRPTPATAHPAELWALTQTTRIQILISIPALVIRRHLVEMKTPPRAEAPAAAEQRLPARAVRIPPTPEIPLRLLLQIPATARTRMQANPIRIIRATRTLD